MAAKKKAKGKGKAKTSPGVNIAPGMPVDLSPSSAVAQVGGAPIASAIVGVSVAPGTSPTDALVGNAIVSTGDGAANSAAPSFPGWIRWGILAAIFVAGWYFFGVWIALAIAGGLLILNTFLGNG